jgi:hypothetical protein
MNIFNLIPKFKKKLVATQQLTTTLNNKMFRRNVSSNSFNFKESHNKVLGQKINLQNLKAKYGIYLATPDWAIWRDFYGSYYMVTTAVNKITNNLLSAGWAIYDKHGYEQIELTKKYNEYFDMHNFIKKAGRHFIVYGIVIPVKWEKEDEEGKKVFDRFVLVPASELTSIYGEQDTFEVSEIFWQNLQVTENIEKIDEDGNQHFDIIIDPDLDDQFLGESILRPFYNEIDARLADDARYRLYLKQKGNFGQIVLVNKNLTEEQKNEIANSLASFRNDANAFKIGVLDGLGKIDEDDKPDQELIKFVPIKQELDNRMTIEEKEMLDRSILRSLQINPKKAGYSTSDGIGSDEYEPSQVDYNNDIFIPTQIAIFNGINKWVFQEQKEIMESLGWFNGYTIKEDDEEVQATKDDFYLRPKQLQTDLPSNRQKNIFNAFNMGILTAKETKILGLGFSPLDTEDDDEFRKLRKGDYIVKKGEMITGLISDPKKDTPEEPTTPEDTVADSITQSAEEEKKTEKSAFYKPTLKQKKKIKQFGESKSELSRLSDITKMKEYTDFQNSLRDSLTKQYDPSIYINQINQNKKAELPGENTNKIDIPGLEIDFNFINDYYSFLALLAESEANRQLGFDELETLTQEQLSIYRQKIQDFITQRIDSLNGVKIENTLLLAGTISGVLKSSLNDTSYSDITESLKKALASKDSEKILQESLKAKLDKRIQDISRTETNFMFHASLAEAVSGREPLTKTWLPTTSTDPRELHVKQYYETKSIDEPFSDGSYTAGEKPNCECGIRYKFKK